LNAIKATLDTRLRTRVGKRLLRELEENLRSDHLLSNVMLWLGAGMDAADGRLRLKRKWYAPWRRALSLDWKVDRSRPTIEAIKEMHRQLTVATAGRFVVPPTWSLFRSLLTLHPLGGCPMGTSPENGVVDHLGHVFGYRNLIVADGAILPTSTGRNPSHTIAALAERIAAHTT
jgi:cholesterol oxidase